MVERARSLRRPAGLSQAELAAGRFSKEYVSQIERGRPARLPRRWSGLAERLETELRFSNTASPRADTDASRRLCVDAELLVEEARYYDALRAFVDVRDLGRTERRTVVLDQPSPVGAGVGAHPPR